MTCFPFLPLLPVSFLLHKLLPFEVSLVLTGIAVITVTFRFINDINFWFTAFISTAFLAIFHGILNLHKNDPLISHKISSFNSSGSTLVFHSKSRYHLHLTALKHQYVSVGNDTTMYSELTSHSWLYLKW